MDSLEQRVILLCVLKKEYVNLIINIHKERSLKVGLVFQNSWKVALDGQVIPRHSGLI